MIIENFSEKTIVIPRREFGLYLLGKIRVKVLRELKLQ